jgi:uncharacterized protein (DUF58 family)
MKTTSQRLRRAAETLEIRTRRHVTALLSGNSRSPFRGSGMQFKEFRHYEQGDDIRHMSWPVTARTGRATIKIYEEDRERDVVLLVDTSGSALFSSQRGSRLEMFSDLVAVLGLSAVQGGDKFGVLHFSNKPVEFRPPRRNREQVLGAALKLLDLSPEGQPSDLRTTLSFLQTALKNRAILFVISDFNLPDFRRELVALSRRHEVILLHAFDDWEQGRALPGGIVEAWDPETQKFWLLDTSSRSTRQILEQGYAQKVSYLNEVARLSRADYLGLCLLDDYLKKLVHFFHRRALGR